eukprot:5171074-Amphidinium_carterae.1
MSDQFWHPPPKFPLKKMSKPWDIQAGCFTSRAALWLMGLKDSVLTASTFEIVHIDGEEQKEQGQVLLEASSLESTRTIQTKDIAE